MAERNLLENMIFSKAAWSILCGPSIPRLGVELPEMCSYAQGKIYTVCTAALFIMVGGLVTELCLTLTTPWTVAQQAPLSMGFSRKEYWSVPSPGDLPHPGIKPRSPARQADSLPTELPGKLLLFIIAPHYYEFIYRRMDKMMTFIQWKILHFKNEHPLP